MANSFNTLDTLNIGEKNYKIYNIDKLKDAYNLDRLPYSIKILLENLLRTEDGRTVNKSDIEAILNWDPKEKPSHEIAFTPSRVILQDFTGVPAIVDLAAMRYAMKKLNGDPNKINPLSPVELVIDHSVMVDKYGDNTSYKYNTQKEFERNKERYTFLKWGQNAFDNFKVVPPGTGIVHQVNLEYLGRVIFTKSINKDLFAYPDTLVGTDSHTTMINGIGVLGWGVGGIEAEAAMLGQPITMLIPQVIGFKLTGKMSSGATATDLVLTVVKMLREKGVVGKFVEFYGEGLETLSVEDRATIANMAPEYGATCGIFPIDHQTLNYLRLTGRDEEHIKIIEEYAKKVGIFHTKNHPEAEYSDTLHLDLSKVQACIAGPKRPQDKIELTESKNKFNDLINEQFNDTKDVKVKISGTDEELKHGDVVIAAITSCTNTSNPSVMVAAGLIAKKAYELGIKPKSWVKTSLAPGSQVVTDYYKRSGLDKYLEAIGFNLVGYGCTTCIGNSGPLPEPVSQAINEGKLATAAVLSGNRNFEGRIHPEVKYAYLASPPLVVIYALAGTMNVDLQNDPISKNDKGQEIFLKDLWPSAEEIHKVVREKISADMFTNRYAHVYEGTDDWKEIDVTTSELYEWDDSSTYVKNPPYFDDIKKDPQPISNIKNAMVLALFGDSITTDHISPAGSIAKNSPAAKYLMEKGVEPKDFNSYGSRRGNHEVMMRGTFANIRLRNKLVKGKEGGITIHHPTGKELSIFDAAMEYSKEKIPLIVIAGKEYGSGSSRDWAAKGVRLLGVTAVIAESYERIHRSNLIGMGVLPLQFKEGESSESLGLDGTETFDIDLSGLEPESELKVIARKSGAKDETELTNNSNIGSGNHSKVEIDSNSISFNVLVRIDTPKEMDYYQHGGILHYVLRNLAS